MSVLLLLLLIIALGVCGTLLRTRISPPLRWILAGILGIILGVLVRFRAFPFLREDMILSAGKLYPTAQWAAAMAIFFYVVGAVFYWSVLSGFSSHRGHAT